MTFSDAERSRERDFDCWADTYDHQPNPMLRLEERYLPALFPQISGAHVLDVGCGTGRWLQHLQALSPASLCGCDVSAGMLQEARRKVSADTQLHQTGASSLLCGVGTIDFILASFVLGYIEDLSLFAQECARVTRSGGHLLISDVHPVTAAERGWTRSYKGGGGSVSLASYDHLLPRTIEIFAAHDFDLCAMQEPEFASSEREIFEATGKIAEYTALSGKPAIYLLRFQRRVRDRAVHAARGLTRLWGHAGWSLGPDEWGSGAVVTRSDEPACLEALNPSGAIDVSGCVLLPGLINAHDHLEFGLFPNLGRDRDRPLYTNAPEWAADIHRSHSGVIDLHLQVPLETRLWWGLIRNLLCGVTTVCHHNPLHALLTSDECPLRVVAEFSWAHSLNFGKDLVEAHDASRPGQPFILHAAEGIDEGSREEFQELERLELLEPRTVLVHGLALTAPDIHLLNRRGASLVVCPTSNEFLFGRTPSPELMAATDRIALGSDSPLTASGDLLDEIRFLSSSGAVEASALYAMVTTGPSTMLRLNRGRGRLSSDWSTDVVAVRHRGLTPARTLACLHFTDVELVLVRGRVQLASPELYGRLSDEQRTGLQLLLVDGHQRWLRAPVSDLLASAEGVLGNGNLRVGGKKVQCSSTT